MGFHACSGKTLLRDVTGELKSRRLFDAGFALRWKRRYAAGSATLQRLHGLCFTRALFVSAGLKARVQRAVIPALESELLEKEELQTRFQRASAHTGASF